MICSFFVEGNIMAKTNKIARYVKGPQGLERSLNRSAQAKQSGLYLVELRAHQASPQTPVPKRKLVITVDLKDHPDIAPKPIKIFHT